MLLACLLATVDDTSAQVRAGARPSGAAADSLRPRDKRGTAASHCWPPADTAFNASAGFQLFLDHRVLSIDDDGFALRRDRFVENVQ